MSRFRNMAAIVVGGSDGIGAATSRMLAAGGAKVAITYVANAAGAEDVAEKIRAAGGQALAIQLDHSNEGQVKSVVEETAAAFGGLHILVNNAAKTSREFLLHDVDVVNMSGDHWDEAMRHNLKVRCSCANM